VTPAQVKSTAGRYKGSTEQFQVQSVSNFQSSLFTFNRSCSNLLKLSNFHCTMDPDRAALQMEFEQWFNSRRGQLQTQVTPLVQLPVLGPIPPSQPPRATTGTFSSQQLTPGIIQRKYHILVLFKATNHVFSFQHQQAAHRSHQFLHLHRFHQLLNLLDQFKLQ
jgi:hypothetical protein